MPFLSRLSVLVAVAYAAASCAPGDRRTVEEDPGRLPGRISTEWGNPGFRADLPEGWAIRSCSSAPISLCVDRNGAPAGVVRLKDLPSLGEEKTTSADQVQAVLAGRINSLYQFKAGRWSSACGTGFEVRTERPPTVSLGPHNAMKYELSGSRQNSPVELVIGYWTFRSGIETVIEASAVTPDRCAEEPLGQIDTAAQAAPMTSFTPELLGRFEPFLDRIIRGSRLPAPTKFIEQPARRG